MTGTQTFSMVDGFTLTINDPNNILGSNQAALLKDANFVISTLNTYLNFAAPLDLEITVEPASANASNTDGLLPSSPQWAVQNGQEVLVAAVKGQTGIDLNGSGPDGGFTIYAGNDGTLKNYGSPLWFDPDPQLGVTPSFPSADADFVSIMTHELLHCLGFASWGAVNAAWNQHTYEENGVWYYKSAAIEKLLGGDLPLAPNETTGEAADHIGNTSITYQPVTSDMMFEWGNYANNRWDFGQVDLTILQDLGWKIQNYQALPLVDPLDSFDVTGTAGNDVLNAPTVSAIVSGGDGDDRIILPAAAGNGNYLIIGGSGNNSVVVGQAYAGFNLVKYNSDYLLQNKAGLDGVSLLRQIETVVFTDATVAIDSTDANKTITATAAGVVQAYDGALSGYVMSFDGVTATVRAAGGTTGTDSLIGVGGIQFSDLALTVANGAISGSASAATVLADLDALQSLAASGHASLALTDGGIPILSLSAAQAATDAGALTAITSPFTVVESASGASQTIAGVASHATTVSFSGDAVQYSVTPSGDGTDFTVSGNGLIDHLGNVAALHFADETEIVAQAPGSSSVTSGNVTELYAAVLDREPDVAGLVFYQNYLKANPATSFLQFAEWFLSSPEYTASSAHTYAQTSAGDAQFIEDSYQSLLHRTPSAAEIAFYQDKVMAPALAGLTPGSQAYSAAEFQAHAQMLVYFSASPEFLADVQITAQHPADAQHWLVLT